MSKLAATLGRRRLRRGILAAFLPLLLVLGLQFWWLLKLQRTSALAGEAALTNFLDAVTTEVVYSYGPAAETALDVPARYFTPDRLKGAAAHFRRRDVEGAKRLFVARFAHEEWGTILFYDPDTDSMVAPEPSEETRAVTVACAPWKLMHSMAVHAESGRLAVEERDPRNRIILNVVTDATSRIVGVAGTILDYEYFVKGLLPKAVSASLEKFFPAGGTPSVVVTVVDGGGGVRYSSGEPDDRPADASRPFPFVFTDHRIEIRSRDLSAKQLARASFVVNVSLSVLAASLLIGGLALVLRTAAREVKLSEIKSDFVSNVSHELRTPLASIRVFGEFLRLGRARTPEKVREYGEYIETEGRRLTQLVDNILDFAKIESGGKSYAFETGSVEEVLSSALKTLDVRLRHEGFEIDYRAPERPLPPARIDPEALGQAIHNVLDNAVKYSGDSKWIGVGVVQRGDEIVVSVEDRGRGISREEQRKVFERFHRAGTSLVHDVRGTGLGLAIVRHVVEAHGGRVTVESEPGKGSVFSIHLPVAGNEASGMGAPGRQ